MSGVGASGAAAGDAYDVVVVGASSAGVGAAVGAARAGARVLLAEPSGRVGGMVTNGVTTDLQRPDASSGLFDEWRAHVEAAYRGHPDEALARGGLIAEPDVALAAVQRLLRADGLTVRTRLRLSGADERDDQVVGATFADDWGARTVTADVFVDATPEGDLLGAVGVEGVDWVVGREGRATYEEHLAPEVGDRLQQAYTYRLTVQVGGRTDYEVPPTYDEDRPRYELVDRDVPGEHVCQIAGPDGVVRTYRGMRIQRCLPGGKLDLNIDLFGANHGYPTDGPAERAAVEERLRGFVLGWLHWLRTEAGAPELGLPLDDFEEDDGFPPVLYVREGRRLVGREVFTQRNAAADSPWPGEHRRSIAIGEYGLDSHCTGPPGGVSGGPTCEGGFWHGARPYGIPYEVVVPRRLRNLLVPAAVSASHVGYSTLRMEPVRMNVGHAAGVAAVTAVRQGIDVAEVDVDALQRDLAGRGQMLAYLPDGPRPGREGFIEAQLDAVARAGFPSPYRDAGQA